MSDYSQRLSAANAQIAHTNIKGKEYAEVNQRILAFWSLFPDGRIATYKDYCDEQRCDFHCEVYRNYEDERPAATGHAFETRDSYINKTSYVENCETSAIGRALGLLGIGATNAIASAEEVANAIEQQESARKNGTKQPVKKSDDSGVSAALKAAKAALATACANVAEATGEDIKDVKRRAANTDGFDENDPDSYLRIASMIEAEIKEG